MITVKENKSTEYIIQKSKFITEFTVVHTKEEIDTAFIKARKNYPGATHYCYAYILDQEKKCSDDGEPSKTAGMPILNVLENKGLNHILCIVIRYFGGIKLGTGGLVRAYTKSVTMALEQNKFAEIKLGYQIRLVFSYDKLKQIEYLLKEKTIIEKNFKETIIFYIQVEQEQIKSLQKELETIVLEFVIQKQIYIVKE